MKTLLFLALTIFISSSWAQFEIVEGPIDVSDGNGFNHPQIEFLNDGMPAVIWTSQSSYDLFFSKYAGAGTFSAPVQLNPGDTEVQSYNWSGPDMAIEGDNVYISYKGLGYDTAPIYLIKSTDNGSTWSDTVRVDNLADGFGQYPDLAVLNDTVYITFMDHDASGFDPQYVVCRSVDGGLTFEAEVNVTTLIGDEACDCCQPEIVVNDDYVIVYFRNNESNIRDVKAVISYDRGETFTTWYSVDDHLWDITSCPSTGPDAHFSDDDRVLSAYRSKDGLDFKVYMNDFDLATLSSVNTVEIGSSTGSGNGRNYPQFSVEDGKTAIVWEEIDQSGDVFINATNSGLDGLDFDNAFNVTAKSGTQSKPDIKMKDGAMHVVYADVTAPSGIKYVRIISPIVGIDEDVDAESIILYPNPTRDYFYLETSESSYVSIEIRDMHGKIVQSGDHSTSEPIILNDLDQGVYFVRYLSEKSAMTGVLPLIVN